MAATKLTAALARAIFLDPRSRPEVAAEFGVSLTSVSNVRQRRSWADATADLEPPRRGARCKRMKQPMCPTETDTLIQHDTSASDEAAMLARLASLRDRFELMPASLTTGDKRWLWSTLDSHINTLRLQEFMRRRGLPPSRVDLTAMRMLADELERELVAENDRRRQHLRAELQRLSVEAAMPIRDVVARLSQGDRDELRRWGVI